MTGQCDHCAQEAELYSLGFTLDGGRFFAASLCGRCYVEREDRVLELLAQIGEWRGSLARFKRSVVGSQSSARQRRTAPEGAARNR